ncbi:hypothetical protein [Alkalibacterium olivapovliticus]|uniref:Uncharacterized protein n=1 Tax=Alkalibacterium olivapovliticus TaxID=99907 RepID=A0A2T0WCG7_9LACT|nr:hypothetical protein [Alkalibacterium olivapovliticus]PRY84224.1 hypothetical protein CLV38_101145 [Alkalibacterium olivapovliticus]
MSDLSQLIEEKPWVQEYLYFDPDLKENEVVYEENLSKFKSFVAAMEETRENSAYLLDRYSLPDYKDTVELISVFKVATTNGSITAEQQDLFFDRLSWFIQQEREKGRSLDDIFEDKDAIALSRLYQVQDEKWAKKYLTWILYELGAISKTNGPDIFGANDSAFQTYDFLKNASDRKWRPQMRFSEHEM